MGGLFIGWIAILPFVMLYGAYEGPKVFWVWSGGFFLSLFWAYKLIRFRLPSISPAAIWLFIWIFVLGVASVAGVHPIDSIVGGSYRHQGVLLFFAFFLIAETLILFSQTQKTLLNIFLSISVALESAIVIEQKLLDWGSRPLGTFGEPNAVAGFLAIGLWWVITAPRLSAWIRWLLYIVAALAIVATQSRTGIVIAALISIALGVHSLFRRPQHAIRLGLILGGVAAVAISAYVCVRVIGITRAQSLFDDRRIYWRLGVDAFTKRPILGYGAESEEWIYENEYKTLNTRLVDFMVDRSHNIFLDVALWSGAIGLVAFVGWLMGITQSLFIHSDRRRLFVFAAWILFACFQPLGVVHWVQLLLLFTV